MISGFRTVIKEEGAAALLTGLGPTVGGYFLQGALKFGGFLSIFLSLQVTNSSKRTLLNSSGKKTLQTTERQSTSLLPVSLNSLQILLFVPSRPRESVSFLSLLLPMD
jgi:hypothetical protein